MGWAVTLRVSLLSATRACSSCRSHGHGAVVRVRLWWTRYHQPVRTWRKPAVATRDRCGGTRDHQQFAYEVEPQTSRGHQHSAHHPASIPCPRTSPRYSVGGCAGVISESCVSALSGAGSGREAPRTSRHREGGGETRRTAGHIPSMARGRVVRDGPRQRWHLPCRRGGQDGVHGVDAGLRETCRTGCIKRARGVPAELE